MPATSTEPTQAAPDEVQRPIGEPAEGTVFSWKAGPGEITSTVVDAIAVPSLVLQFALELAALVALGYWGAQTGDSTVGQVALTVGAPAAGIVFWALLGSPKAPFHAYGVGRVAVEVTFFGVAALALWSAGRGGLAAGFALLVAANVGFLHALGEDR